MLLYFDKMSMAESLEVRVPFMDHDVVSFCYALPDDRKVRLGNRKELLKRASRGLVDDEIIDKKKRGFFHWASAPGSLPIATTSCARRCSTGRALERGMYDPLRACSTLVERAEARRQEGEPAAVLPAGCSSAGMLMFVDGGARAAEPAPLRAAA